MITEEYIKELTNTTFFQRGKVKRLQLLLDKQTEEEFKTSKIVILSEITKLRQICCHHCFLYFTESRRNRTESHSSRYCNTL